MGSVVEMNNRVVSEEIDADVQFEQFWALYPRHVKKKQTRLIWMRMSDRERAAALAVLPAWRAYWVRKNEPEYVPHPSTWLNGERWEDDLPAQQMAPRRVAL